MKQEHSEMNALDHVNTISDTIFVMEFLEEAFMAHECFSKRSYVGIEVVMRAFKQKLASSRDFLLDHCGRVNETARSQAGQVVCARPCGDTVEHRM